jgi:predicted protein tyrosine phosphatase
MRDPGTPEPKIFPGYAEILSLAFWDSLGDGDRHGYPPATLNQIMEIYRFIEEHKDKSILAHCEAGISRSGAIREYLTRRGWHFFHASQAYRKVEPNIHILGTLTRIDRGLSPGDSKEFVWPTAAAIPREDAGPNGG